MLRKFAPRLINLGLSAVALGSRLLLIVALAKLLEPAEVGLYGLFAATVAFSLIVIGGDFYTYSQRELLSSPPERRSFVLQHQMLAAGLLYVVLLPLPGIVFWLEVMPWRLATWFFALLVAEHIAQEMDRLLIALHRQLIASTVLFLRVGLWAWIIVPLMWLHPELRCLETIFAAWLAGCLLAIVLGGSVIWWNTRPWQLWRIDSAWIQRGIVVSLTFLVATLSSRALLTFDRYAVEYFSSTEFLGAYVVYAGMAMTISNILDPAVFAFLYPRLVSAYKTGDIEKYKSTMREMALSAAGLSVIVALAIAALAPYLFDWIDKPIYSEHLEILWMLQLAGVIYILSRVPHYGLYARGADKSLMAAHIMALPVFAVVAGLSGVYFTKAATPLGLIAAFSWLALFKSWRYWTIRKAS